MHRILEDPVSRLLQIHDKSHRRIIALAGLPGSGKSTISKPWVKDVNKKIGENSFLVLGMDGFHLTKKELQSFDNPEEALARRGAPYTFDPQGLINKIKELRTAFGGKTVGWPGFEHDIGDPVNDLITVPSGCTLILVEGLYTLYRKDQWLALDNLFDEKWFLDIPIEMSFSGAKMLIFLLLVNKLC